jgi:hypothetical protein
MNLPNLAAFGNRKFGPACATRSTIETVTGNLGRLQRVNRRDEASFDVKFATPNVIQL